MRPFHFAIFLWGGYRDDFAPYAILLEEFLEWMRLFNMGHKDISELHAMVSLHLFYEDLNAPAIIEKSFLFYHFRSLSIHHRDDREVSV